MAAQVLLVILGVYSFRLINQVQDVLHAEPVNMAVYGADLLFLLPFAPFFAVV